MSESAFQIVTRIGIEKRIGEYAAAGDMHGIDRELDLHPYGRPRKEVSLETAHHIVAMGGVLVSHEQATIEFPAVEAA